MARYGYYASGADYFHNYRSIEARFDSTGTCGHAIRKGDCIGYHPKLKKTQCADCWARWVARMPKPSAWKGGGRDAMANHHGKAWR